MHDPRIHGQEGLDPELPVPVLFPLVDVPHEDQVVLAVLGKADRDVVVEPALRLLDVSNVPLEVRIGDVHACVLQHEPRPDEIVEVDSP